MRVVDYIVNETRKIFALKPMDIDGKDTAIPFALEDG